MNLSDDSAQGRRNGESTIQGRHRLTVFVVQVIDACAHEEAGWLGELDGGLRSLGEAGDELVVEPAGLELGGALGVRVKGGDALLGRRGLVDRRLFG